MRTSVHTCKSFIPTFIHITPAKGSSLIILPGVYIWTTSPFGKCNSRKHIENETMISKNAKLLHDILFKMLCFQSHYIDNNQFNYFQNTTVRITVRFKLNLAKLGYGNLFLNLSRSSFLSTR